MIGRVLWQEFFNNRDWPVASAVAIIMLLLLIADNVVPQTPAKSVENTDE